MAKDNGIKIAFKLLLEERRSLQGTRIEIQGGFIRKEVVLVYLRILFKAFLMCMVLWGIGGGPLGALTIDDFDSPAAGQDVSLINNGVGSRSTSIVGASVPGNIRELSLEIQGVLGSYEAKAAINTPATGETYQLTQSISVDSIGYLIYDGNVFGGPGILNLDLSGFAGIRLAGVENDFSTPFTLTLETSGGGSSTATSSILSGDLDFLFSSLVGTATLSDIDRITILVDPQKGGDVKIDEL